MNKLLMILICFLLSACAVQKELIPVGGSKSDGTIAMGYQKGKYETVKVDWDRAKDLAAKKCKAWGYDGAEPFGGQTNHCAIFETFGGCEQTQVSIQYQCLGGEASKH